MRGFHALPLRGAITASTLPATQTLADGQRSRSAGLRLYACWISIYAPLPGSELHHCLTSILACACGLWPANRYGARWLSSLWVQNAYEAIAQADGRLVITAWLKKLPSGSVLRPLHAASLSRSSAFKYT